MITIQFDVFDLSFIFFIAMSQTVSVINRSGACYFLHASNMVRWIYSAKLCEKIPMPKNSYRYFKYRRFCQIQSFPLVWSSPAPGRKKKWPRKILNFEVNGSYPRGHPKKKWFNIRSDLDKLRLSTSLAQDSSKLRNAIKQSRHVAESNPRCRGKEGH